MNWSDGVVESWGYARDQYSNIPLLHFCLPILRIVQLLDKTTRFYFSDNTIINKQLGIDALGFRIFSRNEPKRSFDGFRVRVGNLVVIICRQQVIRRFKITNV